VLVLTRRANQSIMIGDDVVVTVLDVRGDQVRIGIKAPRSVDVHREEVYLALQRDAAREATPGEEQVIDLVDEPAVSLPRE
jgi:carbon storage regulator